MTQTDWGSLDPAWTGIREELLELDQGPVRLLRADARGSRVDREPQLLVHGLGGSASNWIEVIAGLSEYGPVVALDLAGFGHTPAATGTELSVDGHMQLVLAVADALGWERFALHGNSMGGLIGVLLAAEHPERIERLVLVSPGLPPTCPLQILTPYRATLNGMLPIAVPLPGRPRSLALLRLIFPDRDAIRESLLQVMADDAQPRTVQEATDHQQSLLHSIRSIAALWIDFRRVYRAIDAITVPTIILGGTADALVPAQVLRKVLVRRPDWTGAVIDERRHALMLEDPAEFLDQVAAWRNEEEQAVA
ncbi:alpha/beta fold hydrolase [Nocardioides salsibiostraticola]